MDLKAVKVIRISPCTKDEKEMDHLNENEKIVREAYAAYLRADLEAVLEICSEDTEWLAVGPPDRLPYAGSHRGREQVERYFAILDDKEESTHLVPHEFVTTGDKVIVFGSYKARVNATGIRFVTALVHVCNYLVGMISIFSVVYMSTSAEAG